MKTHISRGRAGFSMVELLVTVLIAGIAFAAMVPLFVEAQQKNVDDNMRVMTLQLARDRIEKIRQLDYDSITQANLDDETFADAQFGNTYVLKSGAGSTRNVSVTYTVTNQPAGAPDGTESYKKVEVSVSWTAPPSPVYPAVLSTVVYKQYAGPQIIEFDIDPNVLEEVPPNSDVWYITGAPTAVDVYIASDDIGLMIPGGVTDQTKWGYVHYSVTNDVGNEIDAGDVRVPVTGEPGHYTWTWDNTAVPTGIYTIEAFAYSSGKQQGNSVSLAITVEVTTPPAPTNLAGVPSDGQVQLTWDTYTIADFSHWELETSVNGTTWVSLDPSLTSNAYPHTGLVNGTDHYYRVCIVDTDGNASPWTTVGPLQPSAQSDTVAPGVPGGFAVAAVAGKQNIQLGWTIPLDGGTPTTGVQGYNVERSANGSSGWSQILSYTAFNQVLYIDTNVGWSTKWYYRVQAVDFAGNASAYTPVLSATTVAQPHHDLTVTNSTGSDVYVWVQSATTHQYWTLSGGPYAAQPASQRVRKNNKSETWSNLPEDTYNVFTSTLSQATQWSSDPWVVVF